MPSALYSLHTHRTFGGATAVRIPDLGLVVPGANGDATVGIEIADPPTIAALFKSQDLRTLTNDAFHGGADEDSIFLRDGSLATGIEVRSTQEFLDRDLLYSLLVSATGTITTTSASDVLMTTMTLTPARTGYYLFAFSGTVGNATSTADTFTSLYINGAQAGASQRLSDTLVAAYRVPHTVTWAGQVTAGQVCEIRWRVAAGTGTAIGRSLTATRLGAQGGVGSPW